jgi:hypothetical protein
MRFRGGSADGSQRKYSETVLVSGTLQPLVFDTEGTRLHNNAGLPPHEQGLVDRLRRKEPK